MRFLKKSKTIKKQLTYTVVGVFLRCSEYESEPVDGTEVFLAVKVKKGITWP